MRGVVHGDGSAARTLVEPMITDLLLDSAALVPLALLAVARLCVGGGLPGYPRAGRAAGFQDGRDAS